MTNIIASRVFVLEIDKRPTLTFEATNSRKAHQLRKEPWLRADLNSLKSNGVPLCNDGAKLSVRPATPEEAQLFRHGSAAVRPSDDMILVYLVELDDPR
jgi:hypothetical protein